MLSADGMFFLGLAIIAITFICVATDADNKDIGFSAIGLLFCCLLVLGVFVPSCSSSKKGSEEDIAECVYQGLRNPAINTRRGLMADCFSKDVVGEIVADEEEAIKEKKEKK